MMKTNLTFLAFLGLSFSLGAQTIVNTVAGNKHAIVEEFTGIKCGNCPSGHSTLANIISSNPGVVHAVGYGPTNSGYTDPSGTAGTDFRRSFADAFYSSAYCSPGNGSRFMPSAFINRKVLTSGNILQSASAWTSHVNTVLTETSPINVGAKSTYNSSAQTLTIDVEVYYTSTITAGNSLFVLIAEDNLTSDYQSGSSASASNPYVYKHLFRENVSTGQWGDAITGPTTQGSLFTKQYVFNLAGAIDPINVANAHIIAFVVENNSNKEVYTGIGIEANGGQASTGSNPTNIEELANTINFNVYPNPTDGDVNINISGENLTGATQLEIVNILGEVIYSEQIQLASNQSLKLSAATFASKGVYFVKVSNSTATATKKLIIQ